jgi:hypothetical protein
MILFSFLISLLFLGAIVSFPLGATDYERPPISYASAQTQDIIAPLIERIRAGKFVLAHDNKHGYLESLLKELQIPRSSQVLVFSKTSLQRQRISPKTPRAIYFNDNVTVGFCLRGDVLEVAAADPNLGTVFYTLDQDETHGVRFTRQTESCLICHGSSSNQGFPGHLIRSVSADRPGELVLSRGTKRVDHSTPFKERWGGWYVTGTSGKQQHLGNRVFNGRFDDEGEGGGNLTDLKSYFTVDNYLEPGSDLVALMVLEHQGEAHNRLTRANYLTRLALVEQGEMNRILGNSTSERSDGITRRIERACETVVEYLMFCEEAKLSEPVRGASEFANEFQARGPFDSKGRSLRQFDLKTRMFRYPLSYVIYSRLFDGLPEEAKARVYKRIWEVLTGQDQSKEFGHISLEDRGAILEILLETKKDLPIYWKK